MTAALLVCAIGEALAPVDEGRALRRQRGGCLYGSSCWRCADVTGQFWTCCQVCCTAGGSLSMCFRKSASVQIFWSLSEYPNEGMPVRRIPCLIFQNATPSGAD